MVSMHTSLLLLEEHHREMLAEAEHARLLKRLPRKRGRGKL